MSRTPFKSILRVDSKRLSAGALCTAVVQVKEPTRWMLAKESCGRELPFVMRTLQTSGQEVMGTDVCPALNMWDGRTRSPVRYCAIASMINTPRDCKEGL
jgi:hypothetical protein